MSSIINRLNNEYSNKFFKIISKLLCCYCFHTNVEINFILHNPNVNINYILDNPNKCVRLSNISQNSFKNDKINYVKTNCKKILLTTILKQEY